ncbi:ribonuclease E [Hyphomicrobium methylovorum]|uniref:Rne/Rng family ribonuclease n=1 Tax=Hyphomicrobium methylovorum TaxID=84 RepID=UPI0015E6C4AB|nr:ribonuclease E/G [Hyphomicrobium methylovorum]MBA2125376.1 ribonuclease E [Hyphomicrobium methylovorum]
MSNTKMLIDATHPEETRVVVQRNGRVEEFDFESAARKLLRGNIYLAKVTRVEPSLQAAFVDYGGNRHGFLAFNEVHPDYYQIPVADRQALLDEEAAAEAELEAAADRRAEAMSRRAADRSQGESNASEGGFSEQDSGEGDDETEPSHIVDVEEDEHIEEIGGDGEVTTSKTFAASVHITSEDVRFATPETIADAANDETGQPDTAQNDNTFEPEVVASDAAEDTHDSAQAPSEEGPAPEQDTFSEQPDHHTDYAQPDDHAPQGDYEGDAQPEEGSESGFRDGGRSRPRRRPRTYKIQEVIKRRQIILVQVVKEERGNKGAALTTYLSLAGRYTVLMPNTARGGGISRKITNAQDRRRLKAIAQELEVPEGMGLIIRTAGAARTKQEIKRDFEYLLRLWESVRELTLQSTAPSLVYEEGDLIKRSIRDLYNKDVEEVVVAGEEGHAEAADFMTMLMPSHAKNVVPYRDPTPLFTRYGVERQLNAMFQPQVTLRSGGYIVINQTEALVAIDVNSGKSTREFSIEETALATNLEAADEIARQLKLRDLAGLIVIDFIDMEEKRNNRAVERRLKDALRFDRARIQLGRISHFGLMEMSRQRLRTGVLEGSTSQCPHCQGTGIIRSTESVALAVLRGIEDAITAGANCPLIATTTPAVALYILNSKRAYIADMEVRHGHSVTVMGSDRVQGANFTVDRGAVTAAPRRAEHAAVNMDWGFDSENEPPAFDGDQHIIEVGDVEDDSTDRQRDSRGEGEEGGARRGRKRRRRGRGGRDRDRGDDNRYSAGSRDDENGHSFSANGTAGEGADDEQNGDEDGFGEQPTVQDAEHAENGEANGERTAKRRRRGRRGGRRGRDRNRENGDAVAADAADQPEYNGSQPDSDGDERNDFEPDAASDVETVNTQEDAEASKSASARKPRRVWDKPSDDSNQDDAPAAARDEPEAVEPAPIQVEQPAAAAPVAEEAPAPAPAAPARGRRHESGSTEPRIERVVIGSGEQTEDVAASTAAAPQRKGWWQRKLSGE